ncbi:hypothetical protein SAMN00767673_0790 [Rubrobacter radiotolerans DSM 5868]|nr:hypothetical protein SAMN00767673_0790 [Rubrobacter radiotolerans DSM 5868]
MRGRRCGVGARRAFAVEPVWRTRGAGEGLRGRRGSREDAAAVSELMDLNGLPRWVAYEESFVVAEGCRGAAGLFGAVLYRLRYGGGGALVLGRPVVDPWADERSVCRALYDGAERLRRELGLGRTVAPGRRFGLQDGASVGGAG